MNKLTPKELKLAFSVIPSPLFTYGNRFMKTTENINNIIPKSPPILTKPGNVTKNVPKMILKFFALFINLNTLNILNVLKIEVAVPTLLKTLLYSKITPKSVNKTTVKSKTFHPD